MIDKKSDSKATFLDAFVENLEELSYSVVVFALAHETWCELPRERLARQRTLIKRPIHMAFHVWAQGWGPEVHRSLDDIVTVGIEHGGPPLVCQRAGKDCIGIG